MFRSALRLTPLLPVLALIVLAVLLPACGGGGDAGGKEVHLYNASYDPTRQLYDDIDKAFVAEYQRQNGKAVVVHTSHAGSGNQARTVIDGGKADVVTLALAADIDAIATRSGLLPEEWQKRLPAKPPGYSVPQNSTPYTSTIVFLVRKGNPKGIKDWGDIVKDGVAIITPDPKASGGARWNYLAAWGWALRKNGGDEAKARAFVADVFKHVTILDSGARGATLTFTQRNQGDVLLAWENEAILAVRDLGPDKFEVVVPSASILAEPPVALVDKNAANSGVTEVAQAYLEFLYTPAAQEIIARHYYRPRDPEVAKKHEATFPKIELFTIEDFGGWKKAQQVHFADGGVFDQIFRK